MRSPFLVAILSSLLLAACNTGPTIRSDADPSIDLSKFHSFAFHEPLSTDKEGYSSLVTARLRDAVRRELEARGCRQQAGAPLLVNFHVSVENRTDLRSTPSAGYYGYRSGMYGVWGGYPSDLETVHYRVGTLTIDVVDAAKKQLAWQGIAEGRISDSAAETPGPAIDKVVGEIFERYPVAPTVAPAAK